MHALGYSFGVGTKSARSTPETWPELGWNMAIYIACSIQTCHTPPELVINADQTGIHLLPSPSCTWNPEGDKQVNIVGKDEEASSDSSL